MKKFFEKTRKRPIARQLALVIVLLASAVLLGPRLVEAAKWNSWTIQYMWHALGSSRSKGMPESPPAEYVQANIWLAQDAIANSDSQRAIELVEPLVLQNNPFALHLQATAMEQQGDFTGALQALIRAKDPILLIALGDKLVGLNDPENALEAYESAYTIDPLIGTAPLADYLTNNRNDLVKAEVILQTALSNYPSARQKLAWYRRLGDNLRKQNRPDDAVEEYQAALNEFPDDPFLHIGLGWAYYEEKDGSQMAIEEFQKAISIDKNLDDGYFAVAQVLTLDKRYVEADPWYVKAIQNGPENHWYYVARGNNARLGGNLDEALLIYQEAAKQFPNIPSIYYELALAYRLDNQPEKAVISIEKAIALIKPPNASYYVRAGQIYEFAGDDVRAIEAYRHALEIDPNNTIAKKAIDRFNGK